MTEQALQKKIIKGIESIGGIAINGIYSKTGEADLQCGIPYKDKLLHIAIEVKTKEAYEKLSRGLSIINGCYTITDITKLSSREKLQVFKLNRNRLRGGLALLAYSFKQVQDYIETGKEDII